MDPEEPQERLGYTAGFRTSGDPSGRSGICHWVWTDLLSLLIQRVGGWNLDFPHQREKVSTFSVFTSGWETREKIYCGQSVSDLPLSFPQFLFSPILSLSLSVSPLFAFLCPPSFSFSLSLSLPLSPPLLPWERREKKLKLISTSKPPETPLVTERECKCCVG